MAQVLLGRMKPIILQPTRKHTATIIFLHGSGNCPIEAIVLAMHLSADNHTASYYKEKQLRSLFLTLCGAPMSPVFFVHHDCISGSQGDTGNGVKQYVESLTGSSFRFPHIKLIYPTADVRKYTPAMGQRTHVWFDRRQISPFVEEHEESIQESCDYMRQLIDMEIKNGLTPERIMIGGFSMGGSLALYHGMRCGLNLAGVFALSSFLGEKSIVYEDLVDTPGKRPPVFQAHGGMDPLVLHEWGRRTNERLRQQGIDAVFHSFPSLFHELNEKELLLLRSWIDERLPAM